MVSPELIWLAGALAVTGIALLRLSWGRPGRAAGLNALGWIALAIGLVIGAAVAGAWGIAVTSLFAVGTAIAILAKAVFEHPRRQRPARPLRETEALNGVGGTRIDPSACAMNALFSAGVLSSNEVTATAGSSQGDSVAPETAAAAWCPAQAATPLASVVYCPTARATSSLSTCS